MSLTRSIKSLSANHLLFLSIVTSLFVVGSSVFVTPSVNAQTSQASCSIKISAHKKKCNAEVKEECNNPNPDRKDDCIRSVASQAKYVNVYKECRDKQNPQSCHAKLKRDCKGKTGTDRTKCKTDKAKPLKAKVAGDGVDSKFSLAAKSTDAADTCGNGDNAVETRFDFGCQGDEASTDIGPIEDLAYSIIRFMSFGVALVIIASMIYAGIQYSTSQGSPEAAQASKNRIQNAFIGLVFYLFIFAFVQYLVPGGLFTP